eukprot:CAMPEP_0181203824 /NCGR_PEP_ID=MMETSP1096-20121128/19600_1 /TAXON_ID=156174 ORGANISM="Chrysochromulina ericina, Strain CCMP281" /NCGR_SAMPLE_ID=MMETSP1096 /ASSEMBLY_ACC=CAM_ASM_000453 /LENGTH=331 /DNA_ID=CAMNT_0023294467 /DNA_START=298 /DNA_END=1292 /DNA_ORIENTATION=+
MNDTSNDRIKRMEKRAEERAQRQIRPGPLRFKVCLPRACLVFRICGRVAMHACDRLCQIEYTEPEQLWLERSAKTARVSRNLDMTRASLSPMKITPPSFKQGGGIDASRDRGHGLMGRGPPVGGSACGSGRPLPLDLCPEPAVSGADGAGAPDVGEPLAPRDADASWGSAGGWLDADRFRDGDADSRHRTRADERVAEPAGAQGRAELGGADDGGCRDAARLRQGASKVGGAQREADPSAAADAGPPWHHHGLPADHGDVAGAGGSLELLDGQVPDHVMDGGRCDDPPRADANKKWFSGEVFAWFVEGSATSPGLAENVASIMDIIYLRCP